MGEIISANGEVKIHDVWQGDWSMAVEIGREAGREIKSKEEKFLPIKEFLTRTFKDSYRLKEMLQKEKFNGRVLIFPLLEIEFQNISVNLKRADILVFTSVYAAEKLNIELKNSETPIFAVGQRCDEFLREIGAKETLFKCKAVA